MVAEGVEDAVGGDDLGGLAYEGGSAFLESVEELGEVELGVEAGDGLELVECAASVAERAPRDHGDANAGNSSGSRRSEAGGGEDGGDEEGGLVADAAGGVFVDCEGVEGRGVEGVAGEAHGGGEGGKLVLIESALEDGHEKRGDLGVGDELMLRGAVDYGSNEGLDFGVGEGEAVALVEDDVDRVDGVGHLFNKKAAGRRSAMVALAMVPFSDGKKTTVSGVLNSWMV